VRNEQEKEMEEEHKKFSRETEIEFKRDG